MIMMMMINITAALSLRAQFNSCGLNLFSLSFVVVVVVDVSVFSPVPKNVCKQNDYLCILMCCGAASY